MGTLLRDLRYGIRMLARTPAFTVVAVLSLALGIGANTTVFSLLDAVILRSLPVQNPNQIVEIATGEVGGEPHTDFSYPAYASLRDHNAAFSGVVAYSGTNLGLAAGATAERIRAEFVSANYFSALGVQPVLGSAFAPDDERPGASRAAVISHALWNKSFGAEPSAVQKTLTLNGRAFSVVGVTPKNFHGLLRGLPTDVWITLPHMADFENSPKLLSTPTLSWLSLAGRLKAGVSLPEAQSQLTHHLRQTSEDAKENPRWGALLTPAAGGNTAYVAELSRPLTVLFLAVVLILAIACANVAGLLLARANARGKEIGIRLALGATRKRIVRQLLTENLLLAFVGGALGLLLALWTSGFASNLQTRAAGLLALDVSPNPKVLFFTTAVSLATVLLFGVVPAIRASRVDLVPILKDSRPTRRAFGRGPSLQSVLVVTQITLSLMLLAGAGLFLRSLGKLQAIDRGFTGDRVLAMSVNMELQGYQNDRGANFYNAALEALASTPGVQSVSFASALPVTAGGSRFQVGANETKPAVNEVISVDLVSVAPRFFETTGLPLLAGRDFSGTDTAKSSTVTIINETMARKFWQHADPVGQSFNDGQETFEVVGVARDTKYRNLREASRMTMYQPLAQAYRPSMTLVVRAAGDPRQIASLVQSRLHTVEPALTTFNVTTLSEHVARSLYVERMGSLLLAVLGMLALLLTAIGIYGVVAYSVAQRTREVGIRMALGAQRGDVLKLMFMKGLALVVWGTAIGLLVFYWLSRMVSSQLYGVSAYDPVTLASVVVLLATVTLLATYIPARRATKVNPLVALRDE